MKASDSSSGLYIDNKLIVDNDGQHGSIEKNALAALEKGYNAIRVTFFEKAGEEI